MSSPQIEAGQFLQVRGIVAGPEDKRTTLEIAQAFGYLATEAVETVIVLEPSTE
jgi:hypothetical protein